MALFVGIFEASTFAGRLARSDTLRLMLGSPFHRSCYPSFLGLLRYHRRDGARLSLLPLEPEQRHAALGPSADCHGHDGPSSGAGNGTRFCSAGTHVERTVDLLRRAELAPLVVDGVPGTRRPATLCPGYAGKPLLFCSPGHPHKAPIASLI